MTDIALYTVTCSFLLGAVVLLLSLLHFITKRKGPANQPPKAPAWPIFGFVPYLYPRAFKGFMWLKNNIHSDLATVYLGYNRMVIVLSYQAFKEVFITKGDNFSGRPTNPLRDRIMKRSGILNTDGPLWKEHRRFALRELRDFGFGRNISETIVHNEIQTLFTKIDEKLLLDKLNNEGIDTLDLLLRSVSNVICTLTMGEQPGYEDEQFTESINRTRHNLNQSPFKRFFSIFPILQYVPFLPDLIPETKKTLKNFDFVFKFIHSKIQKHVDTFDPSHEPTNYIESFLLEQYKQDQRGEPHTYTSIQLRSEIWELFVAGTDTTSNSLAWALLMMALNKDVQKRVHEEIDAAIGPEREPTMKDKQNTPYILAVIDEVQRYTTLVPMSLIHRNFQEDTVMGYTIPADSKIIPFIYGIHHDPKVWERPEEFYPQHFLSEDGKTYKTREELMPFSMGKRICLGEALARVELYIFFVSLLQRYSVSLHHDDEKRVDEILLGSEGLIHSPADHRIIFTPRN